MGPQSHGNPIYEDFGLPLGSPKTKWHLGAGLMTRYKIHHKGEGGGFPQVRAMMNLVSPCWILWVCVCSWFVRAPKCSNCTLTNLLFDLCRSLWLNCLLILLVPFWSSSTPFYLEVMRAKERTSTPSTSNVHLWTRSWIHQGAWGCIMFHLKISHRKQLN